MKKNVKLDKNILIISHIFTYGPVQALVEFLTEYKIPNKLLFIGHPLFYDSPVVDHSISKFYLQNKIIKTNRYNNKIHQFYFFYLIHFFLSISWVIKSRTKYDLAVCYNNFNSLSAFVLKKLGYVKKIVFCSVDYTPIRYERKLRNSLYHYVDKFIVYHADEVWNLSSRMQKARKKYKGIVISSKKQKIVPYGVWFNKTKRILFSNVKKHSAVFIGHLLEKQGIQDFIKAIPEIKKKIPDFNLTIVGTGPYEQELIKLTELMNLKKVVKFTGHISDHHKVEKMLSASAFGVALYQKGDIERNFTYYADPGKIKDYLCSGLPVLLTNVPHNAVEIERSGCGIVTKTDIVSIKDSVLKLIKDENKLFTFRKNALSYSAKFDWANIFDQVIN